MSAEGDPHRPHGHRLSSKEDTCTGEPHSCEDVAEVFLVTSPDAPGGTTRAAAGNGGKVRALWGPSEEGSRAALGSCSCTSRGTGGGHRGMALAVVHGGHVGV